MQSTVTAWIRTCRLPSAALAAWLACGGALPAQDAGSEVYTEALVAYKRGELGEAQAKARQAKDVADAADPKPLFLLGRIAMAQGELDEALKLIQEGAARAPQDPRGKLYIGQVQFVRRDYRDAEQALGAYLEAKPDDKDARLLLLYVDVGRGNFPAAGTELLKLDQFDDLHPGYYFGKAAIAQARANRDRAAKQVEKADKNAKLAETNLQAARTMYGNETFGRYVGDYYLLFPPPKTEEGSGDMMKDLFPEAKSEKP